MSSTKISARLIFCEKAIDVARKRARSKGAEGSGDAVRRSIWNEVQGRLKWETVSDEEGGRVPDLAKS